MNAQNEGHGTDNVFAALQSQLARRSAELAAWASSATSFLSADQRSSQHDRFTVAEAVYYMSQRLLDLNNVGMSQSGS